jgi:hypothetical protein
VQNEASGDWWILESGSDYSTYTYRGGWGAPGYQPF